MAERNSDGREFVITRLIDAPREMVWRAFTEVEHLKHWWGPKGFTMMSCTLDLRVGGTFHYGMKSPEGYEMWGKWIFREIVAPERLGILVSFSDKDGGITRHPMAPDWPAQMQGTSIFTEQGNKTLLTNRTIAFDATEVERKMFEDGFASMEQGFSGTYDQLAEYLKKM